MTPDHIKLVQNSYETAATHGVDAVARLFYTRLFELDPALRPLFKDDISEQRQKLMQMLTIAVRGLPNLDSLRPALAALGERHRGYGVTPKDYGTVGAALLDTLEAGLGEAFTADVREAWTACYRSLSREMLGAAT
jgi:hemoglobin-like flavoprotein